MTQLAKSPAESKTIRTTNRIQLWTGILALLPDLLGFVIDVVGDPSVAAAVQEIIPLKYRALFGIIIIAIAQRYRQLRYQTTTPIQKESTWA